MWFQEKYDEVAELVDSLVAMPCKGVDCECCAFCLPEHCGISELRRVLDKMKEVK